MSKYLCDCRKCALYYWLPDESGCWETPFGNESRWCQVCIDTNTDPIEVEGTCGRNYVVSCKHYSLDPKLPKPFPLKQIKFGGF